jgi:hypothetical protein
MKSKHHSQDIGRIAERRVGAVLIMYGRSVSMARMRQGSNAEPFDMLVDGKPIEVKTAEPRKLSSKSDANSFGWVFNIHRHGVVKENGLFGYVLRLENFPGSAYAVHMFFRAPLGVPTVQVSLKNILKRPEFYQAVQDFYKFAKGEIQ